jgi:hypothetical protein
MSYSKVYKTRKIQGFIATLQQLKNNSQSELVHLPANYYTNSTFFAASKTASLFINFWAFNPVLYLDD